MTDLEKRAEESACKFWFNTSTAVTKSSVKELLIEFAQSETELLSKHLIEMQKTNGALTDRVNDLEAQIEKLQKEKEEIIRQEVVDMYSRFPC